MSQIKITDAQGRGIPYIPVRFSNGHETSEQAVYDNLSKTDGTQGWPIPNWPARDYTLHVNTGDYRNAAFASESRYVATPGADEEFTLATTGETPAASAGPLTRLTAHREGFTNAAGQRVVIAGVSAFMHYERFLKGENIRPLLEQARELGANCVRVFGMAHYIPVNAGRAPFKPADYGDRYFDSIPDFCRLASEYSLYVYWSVFPDADLIQPGDKRAFLNRVVEKLQQAPNTIGELTNEQDAHSFNAVDPTQVDRPAGVAFCSGSYGDIGGPQPHPWDLCDYHQPRRYEPPTHIKDACVVDHPNYLAGSGILLGEPDRYGTGGNLNHDQARQSAGACRETALGMVYHTMQGRESQIYDDATMAQGRVFFKALIGAANA